VSEDREGIERLVKLVKSNDVFVGKVMKTKTADEVAECLKRMEARWEQYHEANTAEATGNATQEQLDLIRSCENQAHWEIP
jgi:hypothetical protein